MISFKNFFPYKIKLQNISRQVFPYFLPQKLVANYFEFVDSNPDIVILPIINEQVEKANESIENWNRYFGSAKPYVVFHTLDEYQNLSPFSQMIQGICRQCNVVFGHQLPVYLDSNQYVPIMYPALSIGHSPDNRSFEPIDIFFWGAYEEMTDNVTISIPLSIPKRERTYRGTVLSIIETLQEKHHWITDFKRVYYWKMNQEERSIFQKKYIDSMSKSKLCLALYGFGYNSFRISEILGSQKALVSPSLFKNILVPEIRSWEQGDIGFFFGDDCSNLETLLLQALNREDLRMKISVNGRRFYERHCTFDGIIKTVYDRLLRIL